MPVEVIEISTKGARLQIERLQVGPYHLFVGDPAARFSLSVPLPEGTVEAPMVFLWYNFNEANRQFLVDIDFTSMPDTTKSALRKAIKHFSHASHEAAPGSERADSPVEAE